MELCVNNRVRTREEVTKLLRGAGITPTEQRIDIGQILFKKTQHVTAERVLEMVNNGESKVSKATVYNTLGLFAKKELIREVIVDPSKLFYDTNLSPHHHFYRSDTGELEDVPAERLKLENLPRLPTGMDIEGIDVIIRIRPHPE
jgi:Fur family iron response transcriptional regulator